MSESTLSLTLFSLREEVAYFLGKSRDSSTWDDEDVAIFDAHIRAGLRMFYNPMGHVWTFFKPFASLVLMSGTGTYSLPDDFGFAIGDMSITDGNSTRRWSLRQVPSHEIKVKGTEKQRRPMYYAVTPVAPSDDAGQRFEISLWPIPDGDYALSFQYSVVPHAISELHPYPYGGEAHAETIREAVLSKAESDTDDGSIGVHSQNYQERLQASILYDRNLDIPDNLGYNGNGFGRMVPRREANLFVSGAQLGPSGFGRDQWIILK